MTKSDIPKKNFELLPPLDLPSRSLINESINGFKTHY